MIRKITLLCLILFCLMISIASAKTNDLFNGVNQDVPFDGGSFSFNNLILEAVKENYINTFHLNLYGSITNNSEINWRKLNFKVNFCDKSNNVIYSDVLNVWRLKSNALGRIGKDVDSYNSYGSWYISTDQPQVLSRIKDISKIDISLIDGEPVTKLNLKMVKPVNSKELSFVDEFIDIRFSIGDTDSQFKFQLLNKTDNPIKVDWSQISYINMSGTSSSVIHEGVKLIDAAQPQAPTTIPPTAKIQDLIAPTSNFYYSDGWKYIPILPSGNMAYASVGKPFSIFMPLEINGNIKNYIFSFIIESVQN